MTTKHQEFEGLTVLIVEDDFDIRSILKLYCRRSGLRVAEARDGREADAQFQRQQPDVVLLDLNLPRGGGFDFLERIRDRSLVPILVISARSEDRDKLRGLELGADDYIVKPFNPREVIARIRAVLRRTGTRELECVVTYPVDSEKQIVLRRDERRAAVRSGEALQYLDLTPAEYSLLDHLIDSPRRVSTRLELMERCLPESAALERTVDSHISHLRRKLAKAGCPGLFTVQRGIGYRLAGAEVS